MIFNQKKQKLRAHKRPIVQSTDESDNDAEVSIARTTNVARATNVARTTNVVRTTGIAPDRGAITSRTTNVASDRGVTTSRTATKTTIVPARAKVYAAEANNHDGEPNATQARSRSKVDRLADQMYREFDQLRTSSPEHSDNEEGAAGARDGIHAKKISARKEARANEVWVFHSQTNPQCLSLALTSSHNGKLKSNPSPPWCMPNVHDRGPEGPLSTLNLNSSGPRVQGSCSTATS
jgi:hypothetical protein